MAATATATTSTNTKLLQASMHILGAGSIGCLFASSIRSKFPSYPVTLLLRKERQQQLGKHATSIDILWKSHASQQILGDTPINVPVLFIPNDDDDDGDIDEHYPPIENLVVTTKAYQALTAIQSVLPRMSVTGTISKTSASHNKHAPRIILLCNGALAVKEELQQYLDKQESAANTCTAIPQLVLATTTHGAYRENANQNTDNHQQSSAPSTPSFVHAGYGQTFIEDDSANDTGNLWNEAGLNCSMLSSEAMNALLWKKLAVNCVINPLTAIYQCTNGELLLEPSFPELQHEILQEVAQVAAAATKTTDIEKTVSNASCCTSLLIEELREFVNQVAQDTHSNKSSMYQDVAAGLRTEIDHLNGYIVRKGRELNVECPTNEDICFRIQELQRKFKR